MNKAEVQSLINEILASCKGITEKDTKLILPGTGKIESHGYQLEIKSVAVKANLHCIKTIAEKNNLMVLDKSQIGLVVIYRQCFMHYTSGNQNLEL